MPVRASISRYAICSHLPSCMVAFYHEKNVPGLAHWSQEEDARLNGREEPGFLDDTWRKAPLTQEYLPRIIPCLQNTPLMLGLWGLIITAASGPSASPLIGQTLHPFLSQFCDFTQPGCHVALCSQPDLRL